MLPELSELELPLLLLELELELPLEEDPLDELPEEEPPDELPELLEPDPVELSLPVVVATDEPVLFPMVVLLPRPLPVSSFAPILDKSENIGLSVLVIP